MYTSHSDTAMTFSTGDRSKYPLPETEGGSSFQGREAKRAYSADLTTHWLKFDRQHLHEIAEHLQLTRIPDHGLGSACHRANLLRSSPAMEACLKRQQASAVAIARLEHKPRLQPLSAMHVNQHCRESLVAAYHAHLQLGAIKPDFHPGTDFFHALEAEGDYINYFLFLIHDWLHLLTSSKFDFLGELKLMSALVANMSYPGFAVYGISQFVQRLIDCMLQQEFDFVVTKNRMAYEAMRSLTSGYACGKSFQSFLALDLNLVSRIPLDLLKQSHQVSGL